MMVGEQVELATEMFVVRVAEEHQTGMMYMVAREMDMLVLALVVVAVVPKLEL